MASTDARPVPLKGVAFRAVFPILDADGDLVTGAASLDSEVSKDQGTFADCTNEATEIATNSGMYYLDLTATEMDADCVAVIVKTATAGAKTTVLTLYPEETGDINVDVTAFGGSAGTFSGGRPEVNASHIAGSAVSTSSAQIGVNVVNFGGSAGTFASGRPEVNASHIGGSAISQASGVANVNVTQLSGDTVAADNAEAFFDGTGYAGTGNVIPTVTTLTGHTPQTGDAFARLGAPAGASVSADIAAIEAQTDDIGAAGAGLTGVPWNAAWDAEVQSEVQDALDGTIADSVPADGSRPSISQACYIITQFLLERAVSGTTLTIKKADGTTTLLTCTLNDGTTPTSITRAT